MAAMEATLMMAGFSAERSSIKASFVRRKMLNRLVSTTWLKSSKLIEAVFYNPGVVNQHIKLARFLGQA